MGHSISKVGLWTLPRQGDLIVQLRRIGKALPGMLDGRMWISRNYKFVLAWKVREQCK